MPNYISMLRGLNVGGRKAVKMHELKQLYEGLGFAKVQTYIQSGNVIFESPENNTASLQKLIENKITQSFGLNVEVLIRTAGNFQKLIENSPFLKKDANKIYVTFLSDEPAQVPLEEINKAKEKTEEFLIFGREIYLFCPNGYGRTKLSNNFFEKKLKVAATTRNWNTVNKLFELSKTNTKLHLQEPLL